MIDISQLINHAYWITKEQAKPWSVGQFIVMMGSNDNAIINLKKAQELLADLPYILAIHPLVYHISQDHTKRSSNDYHNQALIIETDNYQLSNIIDDLKNIENQCGRDDNKNTAKFGYLVALDLDVVMVYYQSHWYKLIEQFPLKNHELICLGVND